MVHTLFPSKVLTKYGVGTACLRVWGNQECVCWGSTPPKKRGLS